MDALIALNRRELELQSELDKIRIEKAALLATLTKATPAAPVLLTPTKVKAAASQPPAAPKKTITIRRKSDSSASSLASSASAPASVVAALSAAAPLNEDVVVKHWKAFKKAKLAQIATTQPTWGKARVKTAIRQSYALEHPAYAASLDKAEAEKQAAKEPRGPSEWLQYVAAVKAELGCSHREAMVEAGRRRAAAAAEA